MMKGSKKYLSQNLLSDFLAVLDRFPEGSQQRGSRGFLLGSIGSKYSATNGAQMQRRNFLSSIFATLFAAKPLMQKKENFLL